jgi:hypothetical protein
MHSEIHILILSTARMSKSLKIEIGISVYETMDALKDTKVIDNIETIKRKQMLKG